MFLCLSICSWVSTCDHCRSVQTVSLWDPPPPPVLGPSLAPFSHRDFPLIPTPWTIQIVHFDDSLQTCSLVAHTSIGKQTVNLCIKRLSYFKFSSCDHCKLPKRNGETSCEHYIRLHYFSPLICLASWRSYRLDTVKLKCLKPGNKAWH